MNFPKIISTIIAEAHCDIPCGIYEPTIAKIAAKTVARMAEQIEGLKLPKEDDKHALDHYHNAITRRIATKETHAETCKRELEILWSDFFKPEHLAQFPNLHEIFWRAVKLASKNKQETDAQAARDLIAAVDEIAKIFYEAKGCPERFKAYQEITDKLY